MPGTTRNLSKTNDDISSPRARSLSIPRAGTGLHPAPLLTLPSAGSFSASRLLGPLRALTGVERPWRVPTLSSACRLLSGDGCVAGGTTPKHPFLLRTNDEGKTTCLLPSEASPPSSWAVVPCVRWQCASWHFPSRHYFTSPSWAGTFSFNFQADVTNCRLENVTGSAHEKLKDTDLVGACRYADKDPTEGYTSSHLMPSLVDPATFSKMMNDKTSINQAN